MRILVSACLLGIHCKYSGGDNANAKVLALAANPANEVIPVCPEVLGGLPTPESVRRWSGGFPESFRF